ncbi:hypothetical protein BAUCODRAFT_569258 [Baudoinia panamericana UAMH 10762]|uniref:Aminotransferase class V domain-containing protein n=1 Tax=Baudoinia panamericana (strain UAMH 10762) TaxID=717646 RepID=M2LGB0_BAUPA|nr:uncharacterized protein BAUCODRAFT_569258 [Baudoinia panamericana UAMH 10762]EMC93087.1 hypothetical protein BAUCODRAFT_569258 [Baudoinia panamericana UAMH 10762]
MKECDEDAAMHFAFNAGYRNLDHGRYYTHLLTSTSTFLRTEARPDVCIRYEYPDTCFFVPNATTSLETVLRNLVFQPGDVIICFSTIYGAFANTVKHLSQTTTVQVKTIDYTLPISDARLCELIEGTIQELKKGGLNPPIAIFDSINSLPAVRMPFERMIEICRRHGLFSCVDGAHGIGQIPLDLGELHTDFFATNCHKWLYVPRGCAVLYVPKRNQWILRSTLPTSFGVHDGFVANFASLGTLDDYPCLCVPAALAWRTMLTWRSRKGEEAIMSWMQNLARKGGATVAAILQTKVLENEGGTQGDCSMTDVRLPPHPAETVGDGLDGRMTATVAGIVSVTVHSDAWWVRLSAQVYLTLDDFEHAGRSLLEVCGSVTQGEGRMGTCSGAT